MNCGEMASNVISLVRKIDFEVNVAFNMIRWLSNDEFTSSLRLFTSQGLAKCGSKRRNEMSFVIIEHTFGIKFPLNNIYTCNQ